MMKRPYKHNYNNIRVLGCVVLLTVQCFNILTLVISFNEASEFTIVKESEPLQILFN